MLKLMGAKYIGHHFNDCPGSFFLGAWNCKNMIFNEKLGNSDIVTFSRS